MRIKKVMILSAILLSGFVRGQHDEDKKLFSINGTDVYDSEFIRVYEKNKDIVVEDERKGFDDYFDLFVDFKLKLTQAREMKLDTASALFLSWKSIENNSSNLICRTQKQQRI